ncbi:STAS domain-containing protein [Candidatus Zixiibacteriota bacterium]
MNVPVTAFGEVLVLTPVGPLYEGRTAEILYERIRQLLSEGNTTLIIDLNQVPWVRSSGIGTLMGCRTECLTAGGSLRITGLNERIAELLNSLQLDKVFDCHATLEEAVIASGGTFE